MAYSPTSCVVLTAAGLGAAWVAVIFRFYARHVLLHALQFDDFFALIALALFTVQSAFYFEGLIHYDLGRHISPTITSDLRSGSLRDFFLAEIFFILGTGSIKVSFALTLFRIVRQRIHVYALYFVVAATVVITVSAFFLVLFACIPIYIFWTGYVTGNGVSHCHSMATQLNESYAHGAVILFVDIVLGIALPAHLLARLQMQSRMKIMAGFILSLGSFASIATIVRLIYTSKVSTTDFLYSINPPTLWGGLELAISIFCTSIATLKPLLSAMKILHSTGREQGAIYELEDGKTGLSIGGLSKNTRSIKLYSATDNEDLTNRWQSSTEEIILRDNGTMPQIYKTLYLDTSTEEQLTDHSGRREVWELNKSS